MSNIKCTKKIIIDFDKDTAFLLRQIQVDMDCLEYKGIKGVEEI